MDFTLRRNRRLSGVTYWAAWAELILGWHEGARSAAKGLARIAVAIDDYQRTGACQALPYAHLLSATVALDAGDRRAAIAAADTGLGLTASQGVRLFKTPLLLIKAQALEPGLEQSSLLDEAARIAQAQGAHLFEARARERAIDLVELK